MMFMNVDFSKAPNQLLYKIVKEETNRMRDRYAAAKELQKRFSKSCSE